MSPTIKTGYKTTFHRDGTVSFWNVLTQTWERRAAGSIAPNVLATMTERERTQIQARA